MIGSGSSGVVKKVLHKPTRQVSRALLEGAYGRHAMHQQQVALRRHQRHPLILVVAVITPSATWLAAHSTGNCSRMQAVCKRMGLHGWRDLSAWASVAVTATNKQQPFVEQIVAEDHLQEHLSAATAPLFKVVQVALRSPAQ